MPKDAQTLFQNPNGQVAKIPGGELQVKKERAVDSGSFACRSAKKEN